MAECICKDMPYWMRQMCPVHRQRGYDRGSCVVFTSSAEIERSIHAEDGWDPGDPRMQVEALFKHILGDNIGDETVRQLIDGVVELINERER